MSDFSKVYREFSNLKLRQLQREAERLTPEARAALESEVDRRGLSPPPERAEAPSNRNSVWARVAEQFRVGPGRREERGTDILDANLRRFTDSSPRPPAIQWATILLSVFWGYNLIYAVFLVWPMVSFLSETEVLMLVAPVALIFALQMVLALCVYQGRGWAMVLVIMIIGLQAMLLMGSLVEFYQIFGIYFLSSGESVRLAASYLLSATLMWFVWQQLTKPSAIAYHGVRALVMRNYLLIGFMLGFALVAYRMISPPLIEVPPLEL